MEKTFISIRTKRETKVIISFKEIEFTDELGSIKLKRDKAIHQTNDGLDRCENIYDDPRFDFWINNGTLKII